MLRFPKLLHELTTFRVRASNRFTEKKEVHRESLPSLQKIREIRNSLAGQEMLLLLLPVECRERGSCGGDMHGMSASDTGRRSQWQWASRARGTCRGIRGQVGPRVFPASLSYLPPHPESGRGNGVLAAGRRSSAGYMDDVDHSRTGDSKIGENNACVIVGEAYSIW
jgi:hypothetical protein